MSDIDRVTDRAAGAAKRLLSPLQNYEVWLQTMRPPAGGGYSPVGVAEYGAQGSEDVYFPG
jgi:hypothetical protein